MYTVVCVIPRAFLNSSHISLLYQVSLWLYALQLLIIHIVHVAAIHIMHAHMQCQFNFCKKQVIHKSASVILGLIRLIILSCKVLEHIIYHHIMVHLLQYQIIDT